MPLLSVKNLSIEFPGRYETEYAVEDVSFDLEPGEILGLVGESGAGTSTIGNGIVQLLSPPGRVSPVQEGDSVASTMPVIPSSVETLRNIQRG